MRQSYTWIIVYVQCSIYSIYSVYDYYMYELILDNVNTEDYKDFCERSFPS